MWAKLSKLEEAIRNGTNPKLMNKVRKLASERMDAGGGGVRHVLSCNQRK